ACDRRHDRGIAGRRGGERPSRQHLFRIQFGQRVSGEHRMRPGKMTAYNTDIHVPLIVTGPRVPGGHIVEDIVQNIDLCTTFTELGFASAPPEVDGRSLVPLLRAEKVEGWRTLALVEHRGPVRGLVDPDLPGIRSGNPSSYE